MKTPLNPVTQLRTKHGLSRRELAHQTGISYPTLSSLEYGLPCTMSKKTAAKFEASFNINARHVREEYKAFRQGLMCQPA